jgi:hypothetical protein
MVVGEAATNIPVTWPVALNWEVVGGAANVTSAKTQRSQLPGSSTFGINFSFAAGVKGASNNCATVRVTATDKYGHTMPDGTPIARELTMCPFTQEDIVTNERDAIDEALRALERDLYPAGGLPRLFPDMGGLVPHGPVPPVDPEWDRRAALINQGRLLKDDLQRRRTKMFDPRDGEKLSQFGLAVARYGIANSGFVTRNPGLASKFYFDTDSQKRWLAGLPAARMGAGLRAVYDRGLANVVEVDVANLHGVSLPAMRVAPTLRP